MIFIDGIEYFVVEVFRFIGFFKLLNSFIVGFVMSFVVDCVILGVRKG